MGIARFPCAIPLHEDDRILRASLDNDFLSEKKDNWTTKKLIFFHIGLSGWVFAVV